MVRPKGVGGFGIWGCQRMCCRSLFGFKTHIYVVVQQIFRVIIAWYGRCVGFIRICQYVFYYIKYMERESIK